MAPSRGSLSGVVFRPTFQTDDPPPSTLAAQIVDSLTKRKTHSKHRDQESFQQLLREILDAGDEQNGHSESIETNVEVNHKIIYVVVRSGIEVLFNDDPFNKRDDLSKQSLSSLAVIGLTIRRSPEVLFFKPKAQEFDPKLGGPLFLWLVSILLNVLAREENRDIQAATVQLLQTILKLERKTHFRGIKPQTILQFIQGCIKGKSSMQILVIHASNEPLQDLLFFIEASSSNCLENQSSNQTVVPTLATISEVYPATLDEDDLKHSPRVSIENSSQASTVVLRLLSIICFPYMNELKEDKEHVILPDYAWILSCLTRVWNVIAPAGVRSLLSDVSSDILVSFLDTLRNASSCLAAVKYESSTASRSFILLAQTVATVLFAKPVQSSSVLEKSICLGLFELGSLSQRAPSRLQAFNDHILPVLLGTKVSDDIFDSFGEDIQVRLNIPDVMV